ncbi:MAG: Plug domain-containing protein [Nitrospira sp. CG24A]|nr:MAG: Plug domain-containing protein [Nitrospira sp. CG24A]
MRPLKPSGWPVHCICIDRSARPKSRSMCRWSIAWGVSRRGTCLVFLMWNQGVTIAQVAMLFGLLGIVALPVCAEEKQNVISEKGRTERIQELQRERANIESELRRLRSQPEGTARSTVPRSEFSDQPTRSMKESLESVPGVSTRQGATGHDAQISIRGSK